MLSTWKGSDYLADLTKTDALKFKDYALRKGHIGSSVKNIIGFLIGFWNWEERQPNNQREFTGRFDALLGSGRGIYFESINTKAVLWLLLVVMRQLQGYNWGQP